MRPNLSRYVDQLNVASGFISERLILLKKIQVPVKPRSLMYGIIIEGDSSTKQLSGEASWLRFS